MKSKNKIFIATSSFSNVNSKILNQLHKKKIEVKFNSLKRKLEKDELIDLAHDCKYIIAGTENYSKEVIDKLKSLRFLHRLGSGTDNVDINYLKKKKIIFSKSKITPESAVAELIVGYILSSYRNILKYDNQLKNRIWKKKMGQSLLGKTVGIIGYGKVGKYLHKLLKSFGANIIINEKKKISKKNSTLSKLVKNSDIISLNINFDKSKKILNKKVLKLCKKNCLIINTSRSDGIDNEYLYFMLKRNKIFGACMDVFDIEPYYGKFTKLENVILTPHIGSYSKEIRFKMEAESLTKILRTKL